MKKNLIEKINTQLEIEIIQHVPQINISKEEEQSAVYKKKENDEILIQQKFKVYILRSLLNKKDKKYKRSFLNFWKNKINQENKRLNLEKVSYEEKKLNEEEEEKIDKEKSEKEKIQEKRKEINENIKIKQDKMKSKENQDKKNKKEDLKLSEEKEKHSLNESIGKNKVQKITENGFKEEIPSVITEKEMQKKSEEIKHKKQYKEKDNIISTQKEIVSSKENKEDVKKINKTEKNLKQELNNLQQNLQTSQILIEKRDEKEKKKEEKNIPKKQKLIDKEEKVNEVKSEETTEEKIKKEQTKEEGEKKENIKRKEEEEFEDVEYEEVKTITRIIKIERERIKDSEYREKEDIKLKKDIKNKEEKGSQTERKKKRKKIKKEQKNLPEIIDDIFNKRDKKILFNGLRWISRIKALKILTRNIPIYYEDHNLSKYFLLWRKNTAFDTMNKTKKIQQFYKNYLEIKKNKKENNKYDLLKNILQRKQKEEELDLLCALKRWRKNNKLMILKKPSEKITRTIKNYLLKKEKKSNPLKISQLVSEEFKPIYKSIGKYYFDESIEIDDKEKEDDKITINKPQYIDSETQMDLKIDYVETGVQYDIEIERIVDKFQKQLKDNQHYSSDIRQIDDNSKKLIHDIPIVYSFQWYKPIMNESFQIIKREIPKDYNENSMKRKLVPRVIMRKIFNKWKYINKLIEKKENIETINQKEISTNIDDIEGKIGKKDIFKKKEMKIANQEEYEILGKERKKKKKEIKLKIENQEEYEIIGEEIKEEKITKERKKKKKRN
jgi:hypothetical protein